MSNAQNDSVVFLSNVRLSFPNIIKPQERDQPDGSKKISWNAEFIMEKEHPSFKQVLARVQTIASDKWKEHAAAALNLIQNDRKQRCFGNGDEKVNKKTFKPYDGYAGMAYISAGRDSAPQIIQQDGTPIDPTNTMAYQQLTRKMYGGCRVNVAVKPWVQDNKHGRGIRCDLVAIQFLADDVPFGEGEVDASGMFSAVAAPAAQTAPAAPAFGAPASGLPSFMQ